MGDEETSINLPCNIEAEQMLIGSILRNNSICERLGDIFKPEVFYDPLHARIFEQIKKINKNGLIANEISLKMFFDKDPALINHGGAEYLAKLAAKAGVIFNIANVTKIIIDAYLRRELIEIGRDIADSAYDYDSDNVALSIIDKFVNKLQKTANKVDTQRIIPLIKHYENDHLDYLKEAFNKKSVLQGITTGIPELDKITGGFKAGELITIGARPGIGKTSIALQMMLSAEEQEGYSCFFSLEMSPDEIMNRMVSIHTGTSFKGLLEEQNIEPAWIGTQKIADYKILLDCSTSLTVNQLENRLKATNRHYPIKVVYLDYLQLISSSDTTDSDNRTNVVTEISKRLKQIAGELKIPIVALCQVGRQVETRTNKRPLLSDLRESGSIEQDSNMVIMLYRENYYKKDCGNNTVEICVAKNRSGETDVVKKPFELSSGRVINGYI